MGNCTSGTKKKRKGDSTADETNSKPNEDVTYASIDHSAATGSRRARAASVDDCDYATVYIPPTLQPKPETEESTKGDCDDDYVLMG
ncbi:uncharacterized protein si:ch211-214p13.7 [Cheilinus undulatus]|uniref:uncharacterized protein si:ch211-214p13.7 n=1 Tax=Cheilinus undulatus TaxID=241271 RepID=UPI001BD431C1|nr:uncharacterized protein si:ch211-214p13.7 [Cheilinus undulatus]